jgi:hypothetical protein
MMKTVRAWRAIKQDVAYPTVDLILFFALLLGHKQGMIKKENQQFATIALRAAAALQRALVNHLTTLFLQPQILIVHTIQSQCGWLNNALRLRTTSSPVRNESCRSSCSRLNLFSARPVCMLTSARNWRMRVTTLGMSSLSVPPSGVCFSTASRSSG